MLFDVGLEMQPVIQIPNFRRLPSTVVASSLAQVAASHQLVRIHNQDAILLNTELPVVRLVADVPCGGLLGPHRWHLCLGSQFRHLLCLAGINDAAGIVDNVIVHRVEVRQAIFEIILVHLPLVDHVLIEATILKAPEPRILSSRRIFFCVAGSVPTWYCGHTFIMSRAVTGQEGRQREAEVYLNLEITQAVTSFTYGLI